MTSPIRYIDSHAHLTNDQLYPDIDDILERSKSAGIEAVINICTDPETLNRGLALAERHPWIYNAASTTPHDAESDGEAHFSTMAHCAREGKLVAIGETGLDYFHYQATANIQKQLLRRYLQLALECNLPVIIHCRDAFNDFFEILDQEYKAHGAWGPGVLHCFTGTAAEAEQVIKRGWYLSLSGIVTFKKSGALREVAKMTPLDQLLIETDAPYLAPQSHRGKTNEPTFLPHTAEEIAAVKGLSLAEVADMTTKNAKQLFSLP